jgi:hypothetical protein
MKNFSAHQILFFVITGVLFVAIFPLPYGLYTAINLFVAVAGGLLTFIAVKLKSFAWVIPGCAAVILYLPAFGQPFEKSTWVVLDLIFMGVFLGAALSLKGRVLEQ